AVCGGKPDPNSRGPFPRPESERPSRAENLVKRRPRRRDAQHSREPRRLGDVFNEAEFKRWWDSTKKLLKKDGHFLIPTRKNDPIELRSAPVSRADELLAFFDQARQPKEQAAALDQIIKLHAEFKEPEKQLQPLLDAIEETARRNQRLNPAMAFELVIGRDDLLQLQPRLRSSNPGFALE